MKQTRIILGIDPGFGSVGYGVIRACAGTSTALSYGCIHTPSGAAFPDRLLSIFNKLNEIIKKVSPDLIAVEKIFFEKNSKTVIEVSHARGVILLAAVHAGIPLTEYTPLQVKQATTGYGRAEKRQMQKMIALLLNLKEIPRPDDAADALAIALCGATTPLHF